MATESSGTTRKDNPPMKQKHYHHHGDQLRVKRNPHGIACSNRRVHDYIVSTGEIGTVTRTPYTAHDGTPMASWSLDFSRDRSIGMLVPDGNGYAESTVAMFYSEDQERMFAPVPRDIIPSYVKDMETGKSVRVDREAMRREHEKQDSEAVERERIAHQNCERCNAPFASAIPGLCVECWNRRSANLHEQADALGLRLS